MPCAGDASVWVGTEGPRALPARGVLPAVPEPRLSPARSVLCGTAAPLPRAGHSPDGTLGSGVCRQACQGLTPKPHAPFDGVGPTSPNLKRHPGLSVRPGSVEPRWPRTPCAGSSRRRRGSACRGSRLPFGSRRSHPRVAGTPRSPPPGLLRAVGSRRDPAGGARCGPAPAGRSKRERKKNPSLQKCSSLFSCPGAAACMDARWAPASSINSQHQPCSTTTQSRAPARRAAASPVAGE